MPWTPSALWPANVWHLMQPNAWAPTMCRPADRTLASGVGEFHRRHRRQLVERRERCDQLADVRLPEAGHAGVHVRPVVGPLVEDLPQVLGVQLGPDAVERRRNAALVAHLRLVVGKSLLVSSVGPPTLSRTWQA